MGSYRSIAFAAALLALVVPALAAPKDPPLNGETRVEILRKLNAEHVVVKHVFPMGKKGLAITSDGRVSPDDQQMMQLIADNGPAARPGDRALITDVEFKGNKIIFEINGGGKKKSHWYNHLQVGGMGGWTPVVADTSNPNPQGSSVELVFSHYSYVPEVSVEQLKEMLKPVLEFGAHSAAEAYMETLPPKVRDAIKNHQVLVGMNHEMVGYALGRPNQKVREKDEHGVDYEEWIYGQPPSDMQFVRFVGDEVVRLEIMKVGGEKVVRTEREMQPPEQPQVAQTTVPAKRPSLRRPGEDASDQDTNKQSSTGGPIVADPSAPTPGNYPSDGGPGMGGPGAPLPDPGGGPAGPPHQ